MDKPFIPGNTMNYPNNIYGMPPPHMNPMGFPHMIPPPHMNPMMPPQMHPMMPPPFMEPPMMGNTPYKPNTNEFKSIIELNRAKHDIHMQIEFHQLRLKMLNQNLTEFNKLHQKWQNQLNNNDNNNNNNDNNNETQIDSLKDEFIKGFMTEPTPINTDNNNNSSKKPDIPEETNEINKKRLQQFKHLESSSSNININKQEINDDDPNDPELQ